MNVKSIPIGPFVPVLWPHSSTVVAAEKPDPARIMGQQRIGQHETDVAGEHGGKITGAKSLPGQSCSILVSRCWRAASVWRGAPRTPNLSRPSAPARAGAVLYRQDPGRDIPSRACRRARVPVLNKKTFGRVLMCSSSPWRSASVSTRWNPNSKRQRYGAVPTVSTTCLASRFDRPNVDRNANTSLSFGAKIRLSWSAKNGMVAPPTLPRSAMNV